MTIATNVLTEPERKAVLYSVRSSIDLYVRYVSLRPETPQMKRRQTQVKARLALLRRAKQRLEGKA